MVFLLSKQKKHINMCTEAKARYLLSHGHAVIHKMHPFTIRLKDNLKEEPILKEYTLKIDPGSIHTGISIIDEDNNVCFLAELEHRTNISMLLKKRSDARRNRRNREVRHRRPKYGNLRLPKNKPSYTSSREERWLPPSVKSILDNIVNLVKKLRKLCNITTIYFENVKFDIQLIDNPNIEGIEYQHGTLYGYEVKEYLLYKFGHMCQYCKTVDKDKQISNASKDNILEAEHMHSKANGGTDAVRNLTIACHTCNQDKGNLNLDQWLNKLKKSESKLNKIRAYNIEDILKNGVSPVKYKYTGKINSIRKSIFKELTNTKLNIRYASGAKTKLNRLNQELPKEHYYDALCVGVTPEEKFKFKTDTVLKIKAYGRGSRFRGRTNSCGIITKKLPRQKSFFGFQTGDIVKAVVTKGKKCGIYTGRVAVRGSGSFNITTNKETVQGISHAYCSIIQRGDGYSYNLIRRAS